MILTALLGILGLSAYTLGCLGAGLIALRLLCGKKSNPGNLHATARFTTALILGQGVVSQILAVAGLALDFTLWLVLTVTFVPILVGARPLRELVVAQAVSIRTKAGAWRAESVGFKLMSVLLIALFGLVGLAALVFPPMGDGEAFYFVYGKFISSSQQFLPLVGNYEPFSTIGLVGELHFAALMTIAGPVTAKAFVWIIAGAACLMLAEIGRVCSLGSYGRLVLVILTLTSTTFTTYILDGKVDLFAASLGLAAYFWALAYGKSDLIPAQARVAGALAGLACVAKFSYIPVIAPSLALIFAIRIEPRSLKFVSRAFMNLALGAAVVVIPHLLKNGVFFGEPLAPFITSSEARDWVKVNNHWFDPSVTAWIVKSYPLALVFGNYPMQGGTLSYIWLAFLPLCLFLPRPTRLRESPLAIATLAGIFGLGLWIFLRPSVIAPRYLLATLLLLFLPVARAIEYFSLGATRIRLISILAGATLIFSLVATISPYRPVWREAVWLVTDRLPPCLRASIYCFEMAKLNGLTAPGERLFLLLYYTYWLRPDLLVCRNTGDEASWAKEKGGTLPAFWEKLFAHGFRLLVVDRVSHAKELELIKQTRAPVWLDVKEVYRGSHVVAYRLKSRDTSRRPTLECHEESDGKWKVIATHAG